MPGELLWHFIFSRSYVVNISNVYCMFTLQNTFLHTLEELFTHCSVKETRINIEYTTTKVPV